MKEKEILFWHLIDLEGKTVFDIADDLGYKAGYIDNVRTGRKVITDSFRFKVAKRYPSLTEFMLRGEPPKLPECRTLLVHIWYMSGDDLEAIAERTAYAVGYLRRMFSGSIKVSNEFRKALLACYDMAVDEKSMGLLKKRSNDDQ